MDWMQLRSAGSAGPAGACDFCASSRDFLRSTASDYAGKTAGAKRPSRMRRASLDRFRTSNNVLLGAIVLGLMISNTVGVSGDFPGRRATYEFLAQTGIVPARRAFFF